MVFPFLQIVFGGKYPNFYINIFCILPSVQSENKQAKLRALFASTCSTAFGMVCLTKNIYGWHEWKETLLLENETW